MNTKHAPDGSVESVISARDKTYVLVHGGFHGGWCWKQVAANLRARGYVVYTPTLTGLGERSHLMSIGPRLSTFIEDVAQVLLYEDLHDVVLVGHSFAGSIVSALADRMPDRIGHLVYLDALLLQSGQATADTAPPELIETYKQRAMAHDGVSIPPGPSDYFGVTDPSMAAWLQTKLCSHPLQTYFDKLALKNLLGNGLPATYIACSKPFFAATAPSRKLARILPGWDYKEISCGHDAMLLKPLEMAHMLAEIV